MKKIIYLVLSLSMVLLFASCSSSDGNESSTQSTSPPSEEASESPSAEPSEDASESATTLADLPPVPDFELTSMDGETYTLSDYTGKTVVLNFWASWCPPCKAEMPDFQELHDNYAEEDVVPLMLNQTFGRETKADADKFIEENEYTFPVLYDYGEVGYSIFGVQSYPTTVVINSEGYLSGFVIGMTDYDAVVKLIEEAQGDV